MSREAKVAAVREGMAIGGGLLVAAGAWMIYRPAGVIVAGVMLLAAGIVGMVRA
jgi:hypothetical protein